MRRATRTSAFERVFAVGVNSERGRNVAVAEHFLHRLHVRPLPHEETRQAVAQVVEPEADLLSFFKHARLHRNRTEMIFHQHVRDTELFLSRVSSKRIADLAGSATHSRGVALPSYAE
jgi:hypothetical protein